MKAILLAGGTGSRLFPVTFGVSKQLLPVYDKPMVYYPLSILMESGIREVLLISSPEDLEQYERLLGDGSKWGISLQYRAQQKPNGLAEAFILGEKFIGSDDVCLVLGDNIFYHEGLTALLNNSIINVKKNDKALIFGYYVNDPERYGVCDFDNNGSVLSIEEKPEFPKSNYAVVGLYFYPNSVVEISKKIKPSKRGELEITRVNQYYLQNNQLNVTLLDKDFTWLDSGTHESMLEASNYIHTIEKRKGLKVACIEEIAFRMGYITKDELYKIAEPLQNNPYGKYLMQIVLK